jgi:hypothetical protein
VYSGNVTLPIARFALALHLVTAGRFTILEEEYLLQCMVAGAAGMLHLPLP